MQAKNDNDFCGGQRSTEVKYSKQCSVATKLGQKRSKDLLRQVKNDDDDLCRGQRSTNVK